MIKSLKPGLTLALMFIVFAAFSQKETRDVRSFDRISLGTSADLYLTIGNKQSVVLEGDEDDLEDVETEVDNGMLKIRNKSNWNWNWSSGKIKVYITVPEVSEIRVSGSGDVIGESTIRSDELKLGVSGSGDIEIEVEADELSMSVSGSGSAEISGTSESFDVSISGSGKIDAEDLVTRTADVSISGSGSLRIEVEDEIDAKISGSGSIYYAGNPDKVNSRAAGSGRVKKID